MTDPIPTNAEGELALALAGAREATLIGDHMAGRSRAEAALQLARDAEDRSSESVALGLLAENTWRLGNAEAAATYAQQALSLTAASATNTEQRAELLCTVAMTYNDLGLHADALDQVTAALDAAKRCGKESLVGWAMNRVGVTYGYLGLLDEGEHFLMQSLDVARRGRNPHQLFSALNNLTHNLWRAAEQHTKAGRADQCADQAKRALLYGEESLAVACEIGNPHCEATSHSNISQCHLELGELVLAMSHAERCRTLSESNGYDSMLPYALALRAQVLLAGGEPDPAVEQFTTALRLADSLGDLPAVMRIHGDLYKLNKERGRFDAALTHHEQLLAVERSVMTQRADARTRLLLNRMDLDLARSEAERLRLDAEIQRLRAAQLETEMEELSRQADELGRKVFEDQLTGLSNRRHVDAELPRRIAAARERRLPISIAALDLDHFKLVNDNWGHPVGDDVLRELATLLQRHTRANDLVGRIGGEEFIIVFSGISTDQAGNICERIRAAVEAHDWSSIASGLAVTLSIGLSDASQAAGARPAIEQADAALYGAKRAGRNRVHLAP